MLIIQFSLPHTESFQILVISTSFLETGKRTFIETTKLWFGEQRIVLVWKTTKFCIFSTKCCFNKSYIKSTELFLLLKQPKFD